MTTPSNSIQGVSHVVQIDTNTTGGCEHCNASIGGRESLAESINHYIEQHGYKLLHVGSQTSHGPDGTPWHDTIALLGK